MNDFLKVEIETLPEIETDKNYWFIRTYGGITFNSYVEEQYVGLGVNSIPYKLLEDSKLKDELSFKKVYSYLDKNTSYQNGSATKMAHDLISFQNEMKIGDTVLIPSPHSSRIAIGTVESDVFLVKSPGTFDFHGKKQPFPEKRRKISWQKTMYKSELPELRPLLSTYHGLTNADKYADAIEGNTLGLYQKNKRVYLTIKINQDDAINVFELNKFLNGLSYFYQEFSKEYGETDEDLTVKIRLQSRGKLALTGAKIVGGVGLAGMLILCNNSSVKLEMGSIKLEGKSDGLLKSYSDFLDKDQKRKEEFIKFQDSIQKLKATNAADDSTASEEDAQEPHKERK